jgi:hypothetical protein
MVVANDTPRINFKDSRVSYHIVDYPCPDPKRSAEVDINVLERDKGTKLIAGMLAARKFQPDYFAIFDADDLVSRRINHFVNANPSDAGWYVDSGYVVNSKLWKTQRKSGMVRYCGSTLIPKASQLLRLANIDDSVSTNLSQEQIVRMCSAQFVDHVVGNHVYTVGYFASKGLRLRPLPFRAACWMLQTGENQSGGVDLGYGRPITPEFCREFGITHVPANASVSIGERVRETVGAWVSGAGALRQRLSRGFPIPPDA